MQLQCPHYKKVLAALGVIIALWLIWSPRLRPTATPKPSTPQAFLHDYEFEQNIDFHRLNNLPTCELICHAYILNSTSLPVAIDCFAEFQDVSGSVLTTIGPFPRSVAPTKVFPQEVTVIYWMPDDIFRRVDFAKSRIYIQAKK